MLRSINFDNLVVIVYCLSFIWFPCPHFSIVSAQPFIEAYNYNDQNTYAHGPRSEAGH